MLLFVFVLPEAKGEEELEIREPAEEEEDHEELELSEDDFRKIEGLLGQLDDYLETTNKKMVVEEIKGFMGMGFMASVFEHVTKIVLPYVPNIGALFTGFEASLEENKSPEEVFDKMSAIRDALQKALQSMRSDLHPHHKKEL
ncbi:unnamed protein product, partial [Mesorhabditis spiculigera]